MEEHTDTGVPTFFPSKTPSKEAAIQGEDDADAFQEGFDSQTSETGGQGRYIP